MGVVPVPARMLAARCIVKLKWSKLFSAAGIAVRRPVGTVAQPVKAVSAEIVCQPEKGVHERLVWVAEHALPASAQVSHIEGYSLGTRAPVPPLRNFGPFDELKQGRDRWGSHTGCMLAFNPDVRFMPNEYHLR